MGRGTEDMEVIESRMKRACEEAEGVENYDYLLINDKLEECVKEVHCILQGEHRRMPRNMELISGMRKELKEIWK